VDFGHCAVPLRRTATSRLRRFTKRSEVSRQLQGIAADAEDEEDRSKEEAARSRSLRNEKKIGEAGGQTSKRTLPSAGGLLQNSASVSQMRQRKHLAFVGMLATIVQTINEFF